MNTKNNNRVAIFASVSTPEQAVDKKDSLPSQIRDGRAWAADVGAHVVATYQVPGHTRKYIFFQDAERVIPAYRDLRNDCGNRAFDVLWTRARNRLGRTDALIAQVEALVAAAGAEVYSALLPHRIGHSSDAGAIYLSSIERATAQVENIQRVQLARIGIHARVRRGLPPTNWPYGYRAIRSDKGETIGGEFDENRIAAVSLMTDLFLAGYSLKAITHHLDDTPYKPVRSARWAITSVRSILYNDHYAGFVHYNDLVARSDLFPHLWSDETHRAIVHERTRRRRGGRPPAHAVSGIAYCARCGRKMTSIHFSSGKLYYRCYTHARHYLTGQTCHHNYISAETLIGAVEHTLLSLTDPAALDALITDTDQQAQLEEGREHAQRALDVIKTKRLRLALAFADDTMTADIYRDADAHLLADLVATRQRLATVTTRLAAQPSPDELRAAIAETVANLRTNPNWLRDTPRQEIRAALLRSGLRIWVEDHHIIKIDISPET